MDKAIFNIFPNFTPDIVWNMIKIYGPIFLILLSISFIVIYFFDILNLRQEIKLEKQNIKDQINTIKYDKIQKILNSKGKTLILEFISYIENFLVTHKYQSIDDLLVFVGLDNSEVSQIKDCLYKDKSISKELEDRIKIITSTHQ